MSFSFSFSGADIEETETQSEDPSSTNHPSHIAETGSLRRPSATKSSTAFPIAGQPLLPPLHHSLSSLLATLPSKICYSTLIIKLDDGEEVHIPRRELWDVKVQLMAEDDDEGLGNLGKDDVRTGVYEGGFKSWESAADLVKVCCGNSKGEERRARGSRRVIELGCGTALPSMALFQEHLQHESPVPTNLSLILADYNPTVLRLVTLPNLLLSWSLTQNSSWSAEGELELQPEVIEAFQASLAKNNVSVEFFSGAWSPPFVDLIVGTLPSPPPDQLTLIGAETIYSPTALAAFADTLVRLMRSLEAIQKKALVGAKKVYFGVGGTMEDFCQRMREGEMGVEQIREEEDGVRRAVVLVRDAQGQ